MLCWFPLFPVKPVFLSVPLRGSLAYDGLRTVAGCEVQLSTWHKLEPCRKSLSKGLPTSGGLLGLSWLLIDVGRPSLKVANTIPTLSTDCIEVEKANWALGIHVLVSALDCGHGVASLLLQVLAALTSLQWWTITWNYGQKQTLSLPSVAFFSSKSIFFINHHCLNIRITEVIFLHWITVLGNNLEIFNLRLENTWLVYNYLCLCLFNCLIIFFYFWDSNMITAFLPSASSLQTFPNCTFLLSFKFMLSFPLIVAIYMHIYIHAYIYN